MDSEGHRDDFILILESEDFIWNSLCRTDDHKARVWINFRFLFLQNKLNNIRDFKNRFGFEFIKFPSFDFKLPIQALEDGIPIWMNRALFYCYLIINHY